MAKVIIRQVKKEEAVDLHVISKQTFFESFAADNTEEDMQDYLTKAFSISTLEDELSRQDSAFYFAIVEDNKVGYLKINLGSAQTEMKDSNALEIERIYVLKKYQNNRIGQRLYDKALSMAKKYEVEFVWLGVWENNSRAIRFYKKNGFIPFDTHIFMLGTDSQIDILMKRPLSATMV